MPRMISNGVQVINRAGVFKKFKDAESPNAISWKWSFYTSDPDIAVAKPKRLKLTEAEKAKRKADKADLKLKADMWLYEWAQEAFAYAMDGGDPCDKLSGVFRKNNLNFDDIDKVLRKIDKTKKGFYAQLAEMWEDMQGDRLYDARNGHIDSNSEFYRVIDGVVTPSDNPWK